MWRTLSPEEEKAHRKWARENYEPLSDIKGVWHPVTQEECIKMNRERGEEINRLLFGGEHGTGEKAN